MLNEDFVFTVRGTTRAIRKDGVIQKGRRATSVRLNLPLLEPGQVPVSQALSTSLEECGSGAKIDTKEGFQKRKVSFVSQD